jgi:two-component system, cell cycle sensor histidine kinase and response regulator CckA
MADSYRVLIVDDDAEHAEMVTEFLKISGPFKVEWAGNVNALWRSLETKTYDIILLDYRMPDGNGLDALVEINHRNYQVPVVMITGQGNERVAVRAMQLGAVDYLIKGSNHLSTLPALIQKAVRAYQLQLSVQHSLEQIRYQALLLNNVRDAIVVWNTGGKITYWNPAAEILFGWMAGDRLGCLVNECYLNVFSPALVPPVGDGTGAHEIERQYTTRIGKMIWVSSRVAALRDFGDGGRLIGYMDIARDITPRKNMEAQMQAAQARLAQSARLTAVGELAAGLAHHINNPLTAIIAEAQLLQQDLPPNHPDREAVKVIENSGWRVQQAVQRLLDFSRPIPGASESVSINQTIEESLALVGDPIRSLGITLQVDLAQQLPRVCGNARQFTDVWVNLLLLARDAASANLPHTIRIRSSAEPAGLVTVEVYDDGEPIPPEVLPEIFSPNFLRPPGGRGTGIEFSICHEIITQYNGQFTVESTPENGTILRARFRTED